MNDRSKSSKRAALELARMGYPVLPLPGLSKSRKRIGKCICELDRKTCEHPSRLCQFFDIYRGTTNERHIEDTWRERPHARVGMELGSRSGLVAIIVDGRTGLDSLKDWEVEHSRLPKTPTICAARDRLVYLFSADAYAIPEGEKEIGEGILLRGEGDCVFAPPSICPNGEHQVEVTWDIGATIQQTPVSPIPVWLAQLCDMPKNEKPQEARPTSIEKESASVPLVVRSGFDVAAESSHIWINEPWVAARAITLMHEGSKGGGCTPFVLHLIRSVIEGTGFLTQRSAQGNVVFLTSDSSASIGKAITSLGFSHIHLNRLHIIHCQDNLDTSWPQIVEGTIERCAIEEARLVVIDRLNVFTGQGPGTDSPDFDLEHIRQPLLKMAHKGIGVFAVLDLNKDDLVPGQSPETPLDSFIDIKLHLEKTGSHPAERLLHVSSQILGTPERAILLLKPDGFEYRLDQPGLFQKSKGTAHDVPKKDKTSKISGPDDQLPLWGPEEDKPE